MPNTVCVCLFIYLFFCNPETSFSLQHVFITFCGLWTAFFCFGKLYWDTIFLFFKNPYYTSCGTMKPENKNRKKLYTWRAKCAWRYLFVTFMFSDTTPGRKQWSLGRVGRFKYMEIAGKINTVEKPTNNKKDMKRTLSTEPPATFWIPSPPLPYRARAFLLIEKNHNFVLRGNNTYLLRQTLTKMLGTLEYQALIKCQLNMNIPVALRCSPPSLLLPC